MGFVLNKGLLNKFAGKFFPGWELNRAYTCWPPPCCSIPATGYPTRSTCLPDPDGHSPNHPHAGCFVKFSDPKRLSEIVITGILRHYLFCSMRIQIFIAAAFLVILSSCGKMKTPEFRGIESVSMDDVKLGTNTIRLNLKYYNPNSFKGQLKWAEGDAWVDSSFLGHFTVDTALKVPPRQEFIVPVKLKVSMQDMLMVAAPLLSEKKSDIWLRVNGQARAGRSGVYKTVPLKYAGKQSLEGLVKE